MFEERLEAALTANGYQRMNSNAPGVYLYYSSGEEELRIISILRIPQGTEVTKEQYHNLLNQIKNKFHNSSTQRLSLLSLILTIAPDQAKQLCVQENQDKHWMVDLSTNRLIIYETQAGEYAGVRGLIEAILEENVLSAIQGSYAGETAPLYGEQDRSQGVQGLLQSFTVTNFTLIIINVIAYLITHFTPFFGGPKEMLAAGALSWDKVFREKEYYRLLTAMFMHGNFSHLLNNMLVLLFIGDNLERAAGKLKYLLIYFGSGIIAGLTSISYNMWKDNGLYAESTTYSIGASGAIFGVVGAVLYIVIINRGRLKNISTRQMVFFVIFSLYGGIVNTHIDQAAHVGGFIVGVIFTALLYRRNKTVETAE
jgi:rhomboid protease GluP